MTKAVSKLFGGGTPSLPKPQPVPTIADPNVQAAADAQRVAAAQAAGRASTVLTSGLGDTSAPKLKTATLG
jgi:hypothetical protein